MEALQVSKGLIAKKGRSQFRNMRFFNSGKGVFNPKMTGLYVTIFLIILTTVGMSITMYT